VNLGDAIYRKLAAYPIELKARDFALECQRQDAIVAAAWVILILREQWALAVANDAGAHFPNTPDRSSKRWRRASLQGRSCASSQTSGTD